MKEYLGHIKSMVDDRAGIGCPIKPDEHVDAILEANFETPPITEVEALLPPS